MDLYSPNRKKFVSAEGRVIWLMVGTRAGRHENQMRCVVFDSEAE
jgi:hypothetical protein